MRNQSNLSLQIFFSLLLSVCLLLACNNEVEEKKDIVTVPEQMDERVTKNIQQLKLIMPVSQRLNYRVSI